MSSEKQFPWPAQVQRVVQRLVTTLRASIGSSDRTVFVRKSLDLVVEFIRRIEQPGARKVVHVEASSGRANPRNKRFHHLITHSRNRWMVLLPVESSTRIHFLRSVLMRARKK